MTYRCAHRWAFAGWGQDLQLRQDEMPAAQGREVHVRVTHCGMCHSDLHIQAGGFDLGGGKLSSLERNAGVKLPVTLGHEISGVVVELGPDAQGLALGEPVVVYPWIGCGACATCQQGDDHLCVRGARNLGLQQPGGFADRVSVPHDRYVVPIGTLDPARAATYACAGITAMSAMRKLDPMGADDHVAVIGCGGVGMTALALYATMSAARIVAIDPDPAKRAAALALGATQAFDPSAPEAAKPSSKPAPTTWPRWWTLWAAKPPAAWPWACCGGPGNWSSSVSLAVNSNCRCRCLRCAPCASAALTWAACPTCARWWPWRSKQPCPTPP